MKSLPEPKHAMGYPASQLKDIIKKLRISPSKFNDAFGVNTCVFDDRTKETVFYVEDVERALYFLGHKFGKSHLWD